MPRGFVGEVPVAVDLPRVAGDGVEAVHRLAVAVERHRAGGVVERRREVHPLPVRQQLCQSALAAKVCDAPVSIRRPRATSRSSPLTLISSSSARTPCPSELPESTPASPMAL